MPQLSNRQFGIYILLLTVACLGMGPYLILRSNTPQPSLEDLTEHSGKVKLSFHDRQTRFGKERDILLRLDDDPTKYKYTSQFPDAELLPDLIESDKETTIWVDSRKRIWQVKQDEETLVFYADVQRAVEADQKYDTLWGVGMLILGLIGAVLLFQDRRNNRVVEVGQ